MIRHKHHKWLFFHGTWLCLRHVHTRWLSPCSGADWEGKRWARVRSGHATGAWWSGDGRRRFGLLAEGDVCVYQAPRDTANIDKNTSSDVRTYIRILVTLPASTQIHQSDVCIHPATLPTSTWTHQRTVNGPPAARDAATTTKKKGGVTKLCCESILQVCTDLDKQVKILIYELCPQESSRSLIFDSV